VGKAELQEKANQRRAAQVKYQGLMSREFAKEGYTSTQKLRRCEKTRKTRTLVERHSGSSTESIESEGETIVGWNVEDITVCEKSVIDK